MEISAMTQVENFDRNMAQYILSILKTQPNVMMSWGFHSAMVIKSGLRFHVNGFQHRGWCEVVYDEGRDTFTFRTIGNKGVVKYEIDDVYFDNLIDVIDSAVETGKLSEEQYKEKVTEWLEKGVA